MVVTAGNRRGVRFSQPGRPAGDRELLGGASRKDEHQMVAGSAVGLPLEVGITKAISENGIDSLVRLVGRRGLQLCAGRIRAANVASGWGTPRRSAGIQARAPTGSHDRPVRGIARTTNPPLIRLSRWGAGAHVPMRLRSTTDAALRASSSASSLLGGPALDLRAKPELHAAVAEVNDGTRHIVIPALIETDAVAMRKPERIRDSLRVHQVFRGYEWGHPCKATAVDGSVRRRR